jgi:hypothetical protein
LRSAVGEIARVLTFSRLVRHLGCRVDNPNAQKARFGIGICTVQSE